MRQSSPAKPRRAAGSDAVSAVRRKMVRTGLVLVLVFAIVDGVFGERGLLANIDVRQRIAVQQSAIDEMNARNNALTDDIRRFRQFESEQTQLARKLALLEAPKPAELDADAAEDEGAERP